MTYENLPEMRIKTQICKIIGLWQRPLVGKKGLTLAHLSADHGVRIFVPHKELKHDVVQLEGSLAAVKLCLRDLLLAVAKNKSSPANKKVILLADIQKVILLQQLPSQSKSRQTQRRTDTVVRKKRVSAEGGKVQWQLTISGSTTEQVEAASSSCGVAMVRQRVPRMVVPLKRRRDGRLGIEERDEARTRTITTTVRITTIPPLLGRLSRWYRPNLLRKQATPTRKAKQRCNLFSLLVRFKDCGHINRNT
jgi:hypothetical protein